MNTEFLYLLLHKKACSFRLFFGRACEAQAAHPTKPAGFVGKRSNDGTGELLPAGQNEQGEVHCDAVRLAALR